MPGDLIISKKHSYTYVKFKFETVLYCYANLMAMIVQKVKLILFDGKQTIFLRQVLFFYKAFKSISDYVIHTMSV